MLQFSPVTIQDKRILNDFLQKRPPYIEEHLFTTLLAWQRPHQFEWCLLNGQWLLIKTTFKGVTSFFPPIGHGDNYNEPLEAIASYCRQLSLPLLLTEVIAEDLEKILRAMPDRWEIHRDRAAANYIYKVRDLVDLPGRAYHQKRNHIKQFNRFAPNAQFVPMTQDIIPECRNTLERWCLEHNCYLFPSLLQEQVAIEQLFRYFDELNCIGSCMIIDDTVQGFTIGEKLNNNCVMIHIEKATSNIPGVYTAINQYFLQQYWNDYIFVNRAEDLGQLNLRKAKMSYKPSFLVMKYNLALK